MIRPTMAVAVTHLATGESVVIDNFSWHGPGRFAWHKARAACLRILRARLWGRMRGVYPDAKRVRTYHTSPLGTWTTDHNTGNRRLEFMAGPWCRLEE